MKKKINTPDPEKMFEAVVESVRQSLLPKVRFKALREGIPDPPEYATVGAAAADVRSSSTFVIPPGATRLVPSGYAIAIPKDYEGQVRSRSGLALRHGIVVLNSPGTIDSDYRGELCVILRNISDVHFEIEVGDRIAQLAILPVQQARFEVVDEFDETARGVGGFGSTGIF